MNLNFTHDLNFFKFFFFFCASNFLKSNMGSMACSEGMGEAWNTFFMAGLIFKYIGIEEVLSHIRSMTYLLFLLLQNDIFNKVGVLFEI